MAFMCISLKFYPSRLLCTQNIMYKKNVAIGYSSNPQNTGHVVFAFVSTAYYYYLNHDECGALRLFYYILHL
jgi:hypothetical protein